MNNYIFIRTPLCRGWSNMFCCFHRNEFNYFSARIRMFQLTITIHVPWQYAEVHLRFYYVVPSSIDISVEISVFLILTGSCDPRSVGFFPAEHRVIKGDKLQSSMHFEMIKMSRTVQMNGFKSTSRSHSRFSTPHSLSVESPYNNGVLEHWT